MGKKQQEPAPEVALIRWPGPWLDEELTEQEKRDCYNLTKTVLDFTKTHGRITLYKSTDESKYGLDYPLTDEYAEIFLEISKYLNSVMHYLYLTAKTSTEITDRARRAALANPINAVHCFLECLFDGEGGQVEGQIAMEGMPTAETKALERIAIENAVANMPFTPMAYLFSRVANAGPQGPSQSRRNRHEKIEIIQDFERNQTQYRRRAGSREYAITVTDAAHTLKGNGKALNKLFFFMLQEWSRSSYGREIIFPLQRLVDLGMYGSTDTARRALNLFIQRMGNIQLAQFVRGKKKGEGHFTGGFLFYNLEIRNGTCIVSVNEKIPPKMLAEFFTVIPQFAYGLTNNGFSLVLYIMYIARQSGEALSSGSSTFRISLEAVRQYLELPAPEDVKKSRKYKEKIQDPIEDAIEEVEEAIRENRAALQEYAFTITPHAEDTRGISEWLQGYIEIGFQPQFAKRFTEISSREARYIERREQERMRQQEKAKAQAGES